MFIAALFTIANMWKQPKCPSIGEWIKLCCNHSRPDTFTLDSGRWKKICGAVRMCDMPFIQEWGDPRTLAASHVLHCFPACPCVSPATCYASRESQLPHIHHAHRVSRVPRYTTELLSMHAGPRKVEETVYPTQSQGYGNTAYLNYPDIWVKESH